MMERVEEIRRKWMHWCEPCKAYVAHVNGHGVSENEALVRRAEKAETALAQAEREANEAGKLADALSHDVEEARAEVERLKQENAARGALQTEFATHITMLEATLARVRAALDDTYHAPHCPIFTDAMLPEDECQCGKRAALEGR